MIDKLDFLIALAREKHFGRAAESCGVTQPTLSAGLKSLEDSLGVLIVNRSSRFHGLTPEGERVLHWARRIVGDTKAMRQDLAAARHELEGNLRIAVIPTALPMVARLTTPFRARHPRVRFSVLSRTSDEIVTMMQDLAIDAGISYLDNEPLGQLRSLLLYQEGYRLVTRQDGAFAHRASVTWDEVARLPLCLLTPDMQNRRIVDEMLRRAGGEPDPMLVSNSTIVLVSHVKAGGWSTILPPLLADSLGLPGSVVSIPIVEPLVRHAVGLLVPGRALTTPPVAALVAEARRVADMLEGCDGSPD